MCRSISSAASPFHEGGSHEDPLTGGASVDEGCGLEAAVAAVRDAARRLGLTEGYYLVEVRPFMAELKSALRQQLLP